MDCLLQPFGSAGRFVGSSGRQPPLARRRRARGTLACPGRRACRPVPWCSSRTRS